MRKYQKLARLYKELAKRNLMLHHKKLIIKGMDTGDYETLYNALSSISGSVLEIDAVVQDIKALEATGMSELKTPDYSTVGISYDKSRDQWAFRAKKNGRRTTIGRYDTQEEAIEAKMAFDDEQYQDIE